jgi:hypothetical protein
MDPGLEIIFGLFDLAVDVRAILAVVIMSEFGLILSQIRILRAAATR